MKIADRVGGVKVCQLPRRATCNHIKHDLAVIIDDLAAAPDRRSDVDVPSSQAAVLADDVVIRVVRPVLVREGTRNRAGRYSGLGKIRIRLVESNILATVRISAGSDVSSLSFAAK